MLALQIKSMERHYGVAMKAQHTITEEWPLALKLKYGQPGAQKEFDMLLESEQHRGKERYMEWTRTS